MATEGDEGVRCQNIVCMKAQSYTVDGYRTQKAATIDYLE